ncbi:MAG: 2-oxoacid:acceptor oxidoreductase family protein [Holosporales bacterium]|jgi:pyruvate ferredoxin oxidoreductase gamma subunit|nr:2-oxoacid:acceptor oxidoreductase family protein [Holosporales bacterium]
MFQIRVHGRGGQGVVTAADMLAIAAFLEGKYAQAFPSFGSERMGAPVVAFCRISSEEIRLREPVLEPEALIIQDSTLFSSIDVFEGLSPNGYILINSKKSPTELKINERLRNFLPQRILSLEATELALEYVGRPIPNAVLLGAFAAQTGILKLESVKAAISEKFSGSIGEKNITAAVAAFEKVQQMERCHDQGKDLC